MQARWFGAAVDLDQAVLADAHAAEQAALARHARVVRKVVTPAAASAAASVSPRRAASGRPSKVIVIASPAAIPLPCAHRPASRPARVRARPQARHQQPVAPGDARGPVREIELRPPRRDDLGHQLGAPRLVLPALGTHPRIGRPHPLRMGGDAAARVQVDGLERPDHRPAQAQPVAHEAVDVGHGRDAVPHQA